MSSSGGGAVVPNVHGVQFHALVLELPVETCKGRVLKRTNHPKNVQGSGGVKIMHKFCKQFEPVSPAEGFHVVTRCRTEDDVAATLELYLSALEAGSSSSR